MSQRTIGDAKAQARIDEVERARAIGERLGEMDERKRMENWIRERVALGHGCDGIYGDDGELQCNNMLRHGEPLDFRRMPMEKVFEIYARCRLEASAKYLNDRDTRQLALQALAEALRNLLDAYRAVCGVDPNCECRQCSSVAGARAALEAAKPFLEAK